MKKKIFTLFAMMCCVVGLQAETVTKTWDFSEFEETVILAGDNYSIDYKGLTLVGNTKAEYTSDYVSSAAGFHCNGNSASNLRYIQYKPIYDGTITVTYRSNNDTANDRITAIGTKVVNFSSADKATSDVLAWGFTEGPTEQTITADLTAGTTYYFYFANGGQSIMKLEYTYDDSGEAYSEPVNLIWDFSEYTTQVNLEGEEDYMTTYRDLTIVGNKTGSGGKEFLKKGSGFHCNGTSNTLEDGSIIRYIAYTPDNDGTLKVSFKSNNNSATDRITAIGTAVKAFNSDNVADETVPEEVLAYGFTNGSTVQTISAELTAGTTYYVYFATGGQSIMKLEYIFTPVVTIPSAEYTTYVTPADVTFPDNIKAYIVTNIGTTSVTISQVTNVPAKTPVILNGSEGDYTLSGILGKAENVSANKLLASDGSVYGGEGIYALAKKDEVGFYPVNESVQIPAGKAYLNASAAVKGFLALEEVTAINNVEAASAHTSTIYNVAGQKVQNIKASGLYIVNGKKVFVK